MLLVQGLFWKWGLSLGGRVVAEGVTPWTWSVINTIHPMHAPLSQDVCLSLCYMCKSVMPTNGLCAVVKSAKSTLDCA